ncbi:MAG: TlpA family protein disulfide reductase [Chloroflexi bacterium]|nr:TlpA family protein disulfide reductase [Chloroflexota bacterium]MBL7061815.1 TlpA family protein disulfide reductase [Dehalococcoidia bacterium]
MRGKTPIILVTIALISLVMLSCSTAKIPQVGDNAPDFTLESIDGKSISLSDFRGKVVLIVFTSVNCKECEEQMPYLIGAYQQANGGLAVLDIYHMIYDTRVVRDYVTKKQFTTFPALPDPKNKVATAYGATGFPPTNFIVDAAGIIRYKKIGPFQSQEEIEDMLKSL